MMIEKFTEIKDTEYPGEPFIGPDNSIWTFVESQDHSYDSFQWVIYESEAHPGILVWIAYCGYSFDETCNDEVWEVFSSKWLYLPSVESLKESLAKGDYR